MSNNVLLRPAKSSDMAQIRDLFSYYVENTVLSFYHHTPSESFMRERYETTIAHQLPYLVATIPSSTTPQSLDDQVIAFAHASPYQAHKLGYGHTVEISIFCSHAHVHGGVGSKLMARLLEELKSARQLIFEEGREDDARQMPVREVLAVVADDSWNAESGFDLRKWYMEKWGFRQVARFEGVGEKLGRDRIDTYVLQKHLQ